jgi:hypothetical protein
LQVDLGPPRNIARLPCLQSVTPVHSAVTCASPTFTFVLPFRRHCPTRCLYPHRCPCCLLMPRCRPIRCCCLTPYLCFPLICHCSMTSFPHRSRRRYPSTPCLRPEFSASDPTHHLLYFPPISRTYPFTVTTLLVPYAIAVVPVIYSHHLISRHSACVADAARCTPVAPRDPSLLVIPPSPLP